ncbi:patatin-like phospholipase family protein [bacterium]|nr:patatin-like phospholipase family protein [bacterium]
MRGFYALGVLKALEEAGLRERIDAVYGVSVGAIIASYWASGWSAQQIWERFRDLPIATMKWLTRSPTKHLLETEVLEEYFKKDLKHTFEETEIPVYLGATDILSGKFILFRTGELMRPLLGSIALPGIFPSVKYQNFLLND